MTAPKTAITPSTHIQTPTGEPQHIVRYSLSIAVGALGRAGRAAEPVVGSLT